jgi:hypothetical protein
MQQSLFTSDGVAAADRQQIWRKLQAPHQTLLLLALGIAGAALTIALAALGLALLR